MHLSIERRILMGFGLVAILIPFVLGGTFQVSARQRELNRGVEHTHEVQIQIQHLLALLTKARAEESGLLPAGSAHSPKARAYDAIETALASLQRLTADNPVQQRNILRLRACFGEPVKRAAATPGVASQSPFPGNMGDIEQAIAAMEQEENRLLNQRKGAAEAYQQNANRILVTLRVLILLLLLSLCLGMKGIHKKTINTIDSITDAIFALNTHWNATYVNRQAELLLAKTKTELLGKKLWQIFPGLEAAVIEPLFQRACQENITLRFEEFYAPLDRWFEVTVYPSGGGVSVYFRDTTERVMVAQEKKRVEEALRYAGERLHLATDAGGLGVWEYHVATRTLTWDERMMGFYGFTPETFPGAYEAWTGRLHPEDRTRTENAFREALQGGEKFEAEFRVVLPESETRYIKASATVLKDENGAPTRMIGLNHDMTEHRLAAQQLETANQQLTTLATTDGLTGMNNHRAFQERLAEEFAKTQRYKTPISLILLDVDLFKSYNDTFGHPEGDLVLKTVARVLQEAARETDYVCRYGGEEFVIILPNTEAQGAIEAAERLRAATEAHPWPLRPITASLGVATLQADLTTEQELFTQADRALYASKERGRNQVTHFADLFPIDGLEELEGGLSLPYTDLLRDLLVQQQDTLLSASEQVREMLAQAYDETIRGWARLLDRNNEESEGHSVRVTQMMTELAQSINMNHEEILYVQWGALLHDVGKMGVPSTILQKPGTLTEEEWAIMRQRTTEAYETLSAIPFLAPALDIPYCHRERWDGTGYPRGLTRDEIPMAARLFAVVDVYDALTHDCPYREAWSQPKAIAHLCSLSGTQFDPRAVKVFMNLLTEKKSVLADKRT